MLYEPLESRTLPAGGLLPFSPTGRLIGQDVLLRDFPGITGAGQTVAVIDTGIDYTNPLLGGGFGTGFKVIGGYDFVDNDPDPLDTDGHGSAVASLLAGAPYTFNNLSYQGVAPEAKLIALRVAVNTDTTPNERIEEALEWVLEHRAAFNIGVVNISFGFGHFDRAPDDGRFATLLGDLRDQGVFIAAAAGNSGVGGDKGPGIDYPAADPSVVGVGAVDEFDTITEYSERGRLLKLLAPGEQVGVPALSGATRNVFGTSFSTPLVAAAAALLRQVDPALSPAELVSILRVSGDDNYDGDAEFGDTTELRFSRLDLPSAVRVATSRLPLAGGQFIPWSEARSSSLAIDEQGVLHVAYQDAEADTLKYVTRSPGGVWAAPVVVDGSGIDAGQYLSLAIDSAGRPGIAYFDGTNGDLRYARFVDGAFTIDVVDSRQSVGLYPSTLFNHENQPCVAYYHRSKGDLRFARFDGNQWWVDDIDRGGNDRGRSVSLAINSIGRFAAAYEDSTTGKLKFSRQTAVSWVGGTIDNNTTGASFVSLAFDSTDRLHASYYDAAPADLKYAVEQDNDEFKTVAVATRGATGLYSQLTLDGRDNPVILYYSRRDDALFVASGDLRGFVATRLHPAGGRYASTTVDPVDESVVYAWYETTGQALRFDSLVV